MLKLQNVSKYYYNKGMITSGLNNVNLQLNCGEFVAITGESGSGKSTLLNVIAGLDTYEDGEMYVNGVETSHFTQEEMENYRKAYIGNIFQDFSLINSYTVYKNIELALLLNSYNRKTKKKLIKEVIELVGLTKWKNTRVSKLSGGQKQRVAIARVLVRNTPIVLADEPTGNLDQQSAQEIVKLLSDIASDKLVIIVTHEYGLVQPYVSRKIVLSDGNVLEDQTIKPVEMLQERKVAKPQQISILNRIKLGLRNTFNLVMKFVLMLMVFIVLVVGIAGQYATFRYKKDAEESYGYNVFFQNTSDKRVVMNKKNREQFTAQELEALKALPGVEKVVENDMILDLFGDLSSNDNYFFYGVLREKDQFSGDLKYGEKTSAVDEVVLSVGEWDYIAEHPDDVIGKTCMLSVWQFGGPQFAIKVTGFKVVNDYRDIGIYLDASKMQLLSAKVNLSGSKIETIINKQLVTSEYSSTYYGLVASDKVPPGEVFVGEDMNYLCKNMRCKGTTINSKVSNLYYEDTYQGKIIRVIKNKELQKFFDLGNNWREYGSTFFINPADYDALFLRPAYQVSIFLDDTKSWPTVKEKLETFQVKPLYIKDSLFNYDYSMSFVLNIWDTIVLSFVILALYLISYFIIRLILRSRQQYYAIVRILGGAKKVVRDLIIVELFTVSNLAFAFAYGIIYLTKLDAPDLPWLSQIVPLIKMVVSQSLEYVNWLDYLIIYGAIMALTLWLAIRVTKSLFMASAAQTKREGRLL